MGVEFSYGVAYGIAGFADDGVPGPFNDHWDFSEEIDAWLQEHGYASLEGSTGGNQMSGPIRWAVVVKRSSLRADRYSSEYAKRMPLEVVTDIAQIELRNLCIEWGIEDNQGWWFFSNVS